MTKVQKQFDKAIFIHHGGADYQRQAKINEEMAVLKLEKSFHVRSSREQIWPLIAQTDQLNREVGLPPVDFDPVVDPRGGTELHGSVKIGGLSVRYREMPFEWVRPKHFYVKRSFETGPLRTFIGGSELQEVENGCLVRTWAELTPRWRMMTAVLHAFGMKSIRDVERACMQFDQVLCGKSSQLYPKHAGKPPADQARLERRLEQLHKSPVPNELLELIRKFVLESPPETLINFRPFSLADSWGVSRRDLLEALLSAARIGVFDVSWRVLCPYCRGQRNSLSKLSDLRRESHCNTCNITYDSTFDENVEFCFSIAPEIHPISAGAYCIGGPGQSPHVIAQWIIPPAANLRAELQFPIGSCFVKSPYTAEQIEIKTEGPEDCFDISYRDGKLVCRDEVGSIGEPNVRLSNSTTAPVAIRIEDNSWRKEICTAAYVTTLQAFRDLFSSEVLSPDAELSVKSISVLFTDLKGSTQMYRVRGDAASYRAVRDHFALLRQIVDSQEGTIVKTIGDAVMAVFSDSAHALEAASLMHVRIAQHAPDLSLKIGVHAGPAIVVNTDGILDYFGQTVNLSARLQRQAEGGETVISCSIAEDPVVAAWLQKSKVINEKYVANLAGIDEPTTVIRLKHQ